MTAVCLIVILIINVVCGQKPLAGKACSTTSAIRTNCNENEACEATSRAMGTCVCITGFVRNELNKCVAYTPQNSSEFPFAPSSIPTTEPPIVGISATVIAASVLIPLLCVVSIGMVLVFGKRYNWIQRLRDLRVRRYNDLRIGDEDFDDDDDDPPLA